MAETKDIYYHKKFNTWKLRTLFGVLVNIYNMSYFETCIDKIINELKEIR